MPAIPTPTVATPDGFCSRPNQKVASVWHGLPVPMLHAAFGAVTCSVMLIFMLIAMFTSEAIVMLAGHADAPGAGLML